MHKAISMTPRTPVSLRAVAVLMAGAFLALATGSFATTNYWTSTSSGDFTNTTKWLSGAVPGPSDDAWFTNAAGATVSFTTNPTNANAVVSMPTTGTMTINAGSQAWWVSNSFVVGQAAATTSTVAFTGGTLAVTNASGTGTLDIGEGSSKGVFQLSGGALFADRILLTNSKASLNSDFQIKSGTLTTYRGVQFFGTNSGANFNIGDGSGSKTTTWNILGGTNVIRGGSSYVQVGVSSTGIVNVIGASTVWSNLSRVVLGATAAGTSLGQVNVDGGVAGGSWIIVGYATPNNALTVSNGGSVRVTEAGGPFIVGDGVGSSNNVALVTGSNSAIIVGPSKIGNAGAGNTLTVRDGARFTSAMTISVGEAGSSSNNVVLLTDTNSQMTAATTLLIGGSGNNNLLVVSNGARLSASSTMYISTNSQGNRLVLWDGALVTGSDLLLATNAAKSGSIVLGGANSSLNLSGTLNVGAAGTVLVTNATGASVSGFVTNNGAIRVIGSSVTWSNRMVVNGSYFSDPSTNTFVSNVTVTASGSLFGSNGDLFVFNRDLVNQSTNRTDFSLWKATVLFTNGAGTSNHTYNVSGSASVNYGTGFTNMDRVSTNFAIGTLSIAPGNRLTITGSVSGVVGDTRSNAVYVGWLDIQGVNLAGISNYLSASNVLVNALSLPDINLYYSREDSRNQWLNEFIPNTGYNLWGGGLLLPIPEPSSFLAVGAGLAFLAFLRRRTG